jgi:RNA polymerase sigma factor (sigma-70 family)
VQGRDSSNAVADAAMQRYAAGDMSAFEELYDALVPRLYSFVLRKVRCDARAEDLVQQTMMRVHCARSRFIPGSRVTPWVYAIATRLLIDQSRRRSLELVATQRERGACSASSGDSPESVAAGREIEALVRAEVARLSVPQRAAFELVHYDHMSPTEAAELLGVTVASIKLRLQRANCAVRTAVRDAVGKGN